MKQQHNVRNNELKLYIFILYKINFSFKLAFTLLEKHGLQPILIIFLSEIVA